MNYNKKIGIAVLTNSNRYEYLKQNIEAFLENTSYRPLVFGIYSNGGCEKTQEYINSLKSTTDVEYRIKHSDIDLGCGAGVNRANELVRDCEYTIFLECDWTCLSEKESGCSKEWLHECVEFLKTGKAEYIYLRRYRNINEAFFHHWHYVIHNSKHVDGKFLYTEKFMYSNNPHVRRTEALYAQGTLPLKEFYDKDGNPIEKKEFKEWGKAEHDAKMPDKFWIHMWGMFAHETTKSPEDENIKDVGCDKYKYGCSGCKYGFTELTANLCMTCDFSKDFHDLLNHQSRRFKLFSALEHINKPIKPCINDEYYQEINRKDEKFNSGLSKINHLDVKKVN